MTVFLFALVADLDRVVSSGLTSPSTCYVRVLGLELLPYKIDVQETSVLRCVTPQYALGISEGTVHVLDAVHCTTARYGGPLQEV